MQLVFYGNSHLWNRFVSDSGMNFLETSNVGNSYGTTWGEERRDVPTKHQEDDTTIGYTNCLKPVIPTISPFLRKDGKPLPYIASNEITVFSIFNTGTGTISSYRFDTRNPNSEVVKFDEFKIN